MEFGDNGGATQGSENTMKTSGMLDTMFTKYSEQVQINFLTEHERVSIHPPSK